MVCNADKPPPRPPALPPALVVAPWLACLAAALAQDADGQVRWTVRLALVCYFLGAGRMVLGRDVRLVWTLGWLAYAAHVLAAVHHAFGWSHAAAVEHTRERGGVGEGIWASHLFTGVWGADVLWAWLSPRGWVGRPAWVGRALHGYMALIVFNGTVVFEEGVVRWAAMAGFGALGMLWALGRRKGSTN